jgi:hypothetical protein
MCWKACSTLCGRVVPRLRWQSLFASASWQICRALSGRLHGLNSFDEHGSGWRRSTSDDHVSFLVIARVGDRAAYGGQASLLGMMIRNNGLMRAAARPPGGHVLAVPAQLSRWSSRRPSRMFSEMTRGQRTGRSSRSLRCPRSGCEPPYPLTASMGARGRAGGAPRPSLLTCSNKYPGNGSPRPDRAFSLICRSLDIFEYRSALQNFI